MEAEETEISPSRIPFNMYEVPGHGMIDPKKYLGCKKWDDSIREAAQKAKHDAHILGISNQFNTMNETARTQWIKFTLSHEDPTMQREAAKAILYAPEEARAELIEITLSKENLWVQREAAEAIGHAPAHDQTRLRVIVQKIIKKALAQEDHEAQKEALFMIQFAPYEERATLIKIALSKKIPRCKEKWRD